MAERYLVVCLPEMDLIAEAIGPFYSYDKALDIVERIDQAYDNANLEINGAAQVVRLSTEAEFMQKWFPKEAPE